MKEIIERLKSNTPPFFKKIRKWCVAIGAASVSTMTYITTQGIELPVWVDKAIQFGIALGVIGFFLSSLATTESGAFKDRP